MTVTITREEAEEAIGVWISSRLANEFDVDGVSIGLDADHEIIITADVIEAPKE